MRAHEFIRDHVTFKLPYDFSYQMKTPFEPPKNHIMQLFSADATIIFKELKQKFANENL